MSVLLAFLDVGAMEVAASGGEPDAALVARVRPGGALAASQEGSLTEAKRALDAG